MSIEMDISWFWFQGSGITHKIKMQFTGRYKTYPYNHNANLRATVGVQNFEPLHHNTTKSKTIFFSNF